MGSKKTTKPKKKTVKKKVAKKPAKKKTAKTKRAPTDAGAETATSSPPNPVASASSGDIAPVSLASANEDTRSHADDEIDNNIDNDEFDDEDEGYF
jgi:hypothetical protein